MWRRENKYNEPTQSVAGGAGMWRGEKVKHSPRQRFTYWRWWLKQQPEWRDLNDAQVDNIIAVFASRWETTDRHHGRVVSVMLQGRREMRWEDPPWEPPVYRRLDMPLEVFRLGPRATIDVEV